MTKPSLKRRLMALETDNNRATGGELVYSTIEEAERAGMTGGVLIIGPVMTPEEFASVAPAQQRQLIAS